jgi:hypothetical protein
LTSLRATQVSIYSKEIVAFKKVVAHAQSILGVGAFEVSPSSGWSQNYINVNDPVELERASRLQDFAIAHVSKSTSGAYIGYRNPFVFFVWGFVEA